MSSGTGLPGDDVHGKERGWPCGRGGLRQVARLGVSRCTFSGGQWERIVGAKYDETLAGD